MHAWAYDFSGFATSRHNGNRLIVCSDKGPICSRLHEGCKNEKYRTLILVVLNHDNFAMYNGSTLLLLVCKGKYNAIEQL